MTCAGCVCGAVRTGCGALTASPLWDAGLRLGLSGRVVDVGWGTGALVGVEGWHLASCSECHLPGSWGTFCAFWDRQFSADSFARYDTPYCYGRLAPRQAPGVVLCTTMWDWQRRDAVTIFKP